MLENVRVSETMCFPINSNIRTQQGYLFFACDRCFHRVLLLFESCRRYCGFLIHCKQRRQVMKKVIVAALATALSLATTAAFAQASGTMAKEPMASGTMAKEPMSKDTMKKGNTKHSKMKKGSDATGMKPEASGTMGQ